MDKMQSDELSCISLENILSDEDFDMQESEEGAVSDASVKLSHPTTDTVLSLSQTNISINAKKKALSKEVCTKSVENINSSNCIFHEHVLPADNPSDNSQWKLSLQNIMGEHLESFKSMNSLEGTNLKKLFSDCVKATGKQSCDESNFGKGKRFILETEQSQNKVDSSFLQSVKQSCSQDSGRCSRGQFIEGATQIQKPVIRSVKELNFPSSTKEQQEVAFMTSRQETMHSPKTRISHLNKLRVGGEVPWSHSAMNPFVSTHNEEATCIANSDILGTLPSISDEGAELFKEITKIINAPICSLAASTQSSILPKPIAEKPTAKKSAPLLNKSKKESRDIKRNIKKHSKKRVHVIEERELKTEGSSLKKGTVDEVGCTEKLLPAKAKRRRSKAVKQAVKDRKKNRRNGKCEAIGLIKVGRFNATKKKEELGVKPNMASSELPRKKAELKKRTRSDLESDLEGVCGHKTDSDNVVPNSNEKNVDFTIRILQLSDILSDYREEQSSNTMSKELCRNSTEDSHLVSVNEISDDDTTCKTLQHPNKQMKPESRSGMKLNSDATTDFDELTYQNPSCQQEVIKCDISGTSCENTSNDDKQIVMCNETNSVKDDNNLSLLSNCGSRKLVSPVCSDSVESPSPKLKEEPVSSLENTQQAEHQYRDKKKPKQQNKRFKINPELAASQCNSPIQQANGKSGLLKNENSSPYADHPTLNPVASGLVKASSASEPFVCLASPDSITCEKASRQVGRKVISHSCKDTCMPVSQFDTHRQVIPELGFRNNYNRANAQNVVATISENAFQTLALRNDVLENNDLPEVIEENEANQKLISQLFLKGSEALVKCNAEEQLDQISKPSDGSILNLRIKDTRSLAEGEYLNLNEKIDRSVSQQDDGKFTSEKNFPFNSDNISSEEFLENFLTYVLRATNILSNDNNERSAALSDMMTSVLRRVRNGEKYDLKVNSKQSFLNSGQVASYPQGSAKYQLKITFEFPNQQNVSHNSVPNSVINDEDNQTPERIVPVTDILLCNASSEESNGRKQVNSVKEVSSTNLIDKYWNWSHGS